MKAENLNNENQKKSGFFDLPKDDKTCKHPEHNVPGHLCIPEGKGYNHVCPGCGNETTVIPQQITMLKS